MSALSSYAGAYANFAVNSLKLSHEKQKLGSVNEILVKQG